MHRERFYFTPNKKHSAIASGFFLLCLLFLFVNVLSGQHVYAADGISKVINFQGKVVNSNGTNVSDNTYDFVIKIYDGAGNSASILFTESWTSAALFSSTMSTAPTTTDDTLVYSSNTNESTLKVGQILTNTTKAESVIITSVNTSTNTLGISRTRQNWNTSDTITNKIYVKDGVFKVAINSLNADLSGVDFNSDSIFMGVNFSDDGEMKPRIQYTAAPYAFNAEKVNGLTVTNTSDTPFSSTTILKIGDGKTVSIGNSLTLNGTDSTTFTFPGANGTVVTLDSTGTLTNKTIGSTGLTFDGATTDVTTGTNQDFVLSPNGTGKIGLGTTGPSAYLDVRSILGTIPAASISAQTSYATLSVDNLGSGDVFTASASGLTRFTIRNNGLVGIGTTLPEGTLEVQGTEAQDAVFVLDSDDGDDDADTWFIKSVASDNDLSFLNHTTEVFNLTSAGTLTLGAYTTDANAVLYTNTSGVVTRVTETETGDLCLLSGSGASGAPTWGSCPGGEGGGTNYWQLGASTGVLTQGNLTTDVLLGATATSSAKFAFVNMIGSGTPTASVSATGATDRPGISIGGDGTIQSINNGLLTIGGNTTGNIALNPLNGTGLVYIGGVSPTTAEFRFDPNASTAMLYLGTDEIKNGGLTFYSSGTETDPTIAADASGNLVILAPTGEVQIGSGGDILMNLAASTENLIADRTFTAGGNISDTDYTFSRIITGGANTLGGAVFKIEDTSSGSTTIDPTLLLVDAALTSGTFTGNLLDLQVDSTSVLKVDASGVLTVGTSSNGLIFTPGSGPTYAGSGRPTKKVTLNAEYPGAVLTASGSAATNGSMTSDASPSAALSNWRTYYEWNSSQTSLQDYTVVVRVKLPEDFSAWATSNALQIGYNTELTGSNQSALDVLIYNADTSLTAQQQATPVVYRQGNVSSSVKTWLNLTIDDSELDSGAAADLDAAGDVMTIYLKLASKDDTHVQVGDIVLSYLSKF